MGQQVHRQEINEYPEEIKSEYLRLSEWVRETRKTFGPRVQVRIVDPQSFLGFWKVVRHRIRRFPTFFLDGTEKIVGWDGDPDAAVRRSLTHRTEPAPEEKTRP